MKVPIRWMLAVSAFVLLFAAGSAAAASPSEFCLVLTSDIIGVEQRVFLNYTDVKNGLSDVYGKACYTLAAPGFGPVTDCAPIAGSAIIQNGRIPGTLDFTPMLEIAVNGTEHHDIFGHATTTTAGTHIWIKNLDDLTGTWAAQSSTTVEGVIENLFQFDAGTVAGVSCPAKTDQDKQQQKLLKDTLKALEHL